jgi:hypothetical protein
MNDFVVVYHRQNEVAGGRARLPEQKETFVETIFPKNFFCSAPSLETVVPFATCSVKRHLRVAFNISFVTKLHNKTTQM